MTKQELGAKIKSRREELNRLHGGFTQADIASQLGLSREGYSHYENGRSDITALDLDRLAKILIVSTSYFYNSEEETLRQEIVYEPILDELRVTSFSGVMTPDDIEDIADYVRFKHQQKVKRRGGG